MIHDSSPHPSSSKANKWLGQGQCKVINERCLVPDVLLYSLHWVYARHSPAHGHQKPIALADELLSPAQRWQHCTCCVCQAQNTHSSDWVLAGNNGKKITFERQHRRPNLLYCTPTHEFSNSNLLLVIQTVYGKSVGPIIYSLAWCDQVMQFDDTSSYNV